MSMFTRTALCFMGCVFLLSSTSLGCFVVGDLNGDCQVGIGDLVLMTSQWMETSSCGSETGLVLHWKFDEVSGLYAADASGSGKTGTVYGAGWNPMGGKLGGALQFDQVDNYVYAYVEGNPSTIFRGITGTSPRSCTAWIKTDKPSGGIMSWGSEVNSQLWLIWVNEKGVIRVDVGDIDVDGGYIIGTTLLTDDLWHHIAVTSNGTSTDNIALYVDGKLETIGGVVSQSINTAYTLPMTLGKYYSTFKVFNGLIDDPRVYNRVLSLQEVWNLATTGTTNNSCADLNTDRIVNLGDVAQLAQSWMLGAPLVVISEFLADNESKSPLGQGDILDGNGASSDWIEIHNNSGMVMDINGWYLTDDAALKTQWRFPTGMAQLQLQPGAYLIVFASGKTQAENPGNYPYVDPAGYLHTNFQLSKDGEYLGLIDADGTTIVHEYNHINLGDEYGYPIQETDISYGYYYDEERYFSVPTPGADNNKGSFEVVVEKPDVNFKGGCYVGAVDVTMNCGTPGAFIRYTIDGTVPTLINGLEYTGPIHISSLTTILAKAFKPSMQPSETRIETYILVDSAAAVFTSNLPIVVVDTLGVTIPNDPTNKTPAHCRAVIIDTDAVTGRASLTGPEHFTGWGDIKRRGESTYGQGNYGIEVQDEYRLDKDVSLLGMPAESDWVLSYDVIDYTMMKKEMAYKWFRDMGHYAPRQRYVELYLNTDGGVISTADYKGLFMLREKIKPNENRVDIARLDTSHNIEPKVSGGYIVKCDKLDTGDNLLADGTAGLIDPDYLEAASYGINYAGGGKPIVDYPDILITGAQMRWIADYINEFHSVLWQNTASSYYPGPQAKYTDYIDVISWVDHGLLEQVCCDSDAFWGSYYTHKEREGKHYSGPPWDYDRGFHNNAGIYDQPYTGWKTNGEIFGKWHQQLQTNLEYKILLADRWFEHREKVLNTALTMAYIDQTKALISESRSRPKKTYPKPFDEEINLFKTWITNRLNYLDGYIASTFAKTPPIFSPVGGYVNSGSSIGMSLPSGATGSIYYTVNGQDPRLEGGSINPNAAVYSGGGSVQTTETVVTMSSSVWKYLYDGSNQATAWRAYGFNDSSWGSGPGQLGFGDSDEATNIGPKVNGRRTAYFRHKFTVSTVSELTALKITLIHDDGAVVYINDQEVGRIYMPTGTIAYNTPANAAGENTNTVFSGISPFVLLEGNNILAVEVHQNSDTSSDLSFDLNLEATRVTVVPPQQPVLNKSTCVKARIKDGTNWSAINTEVYGIGPVLQNLRISELMYHPADPNTEFIELQNVGAEEINLNLAHFTDGIDFTFGDYTLAAGDYVLIVENQTDFQAKYGTGLPIAGQYLGALDNDGEEIVLRDALGAEIHDFDYKDSWYELTDGPGFSLTMVDPAGTEPNLWDEKVGWRSSLAAGGTPGGVDTVLAAGSIVINELRAHSHQADPDWVELYNTTGQDINLGGWFLSDRNNDDPNIMKYEIPAGTVINSHSYAVFVENVTFGNPSAPGCNTPFGLSEAGETVYLYSGQSGQVTGYYQTEENFDASETDMTFGRYEKAELSGGYDFVRQSSPSQGAVNNGPLIPAVVMTEIYYNPPSGGAYEFVELYNRSGSAVTLMSEASTETSPGVFVTESIPWRLEGTGFEFPANTTIPAGGRIIVAKTPTLYGGPSSTVLGPYDGALDNGGEELEIQMPGDQEYGQSRYWIPIEKVDYDDVAPWPTSADGGGHSLYRLNVNTYGRDYSNWSAAAPTPGS